MDKPLPEVPQPVPSTKTLQPNAAWANLTVDNRSHLRGFILHALEESRDVIQPDEREPWAIGIEGALNELGERILMGGWLPGLRRARRRKAVALERERLKVHERAIRADSTDTMPKGDTMRMDMAYPLLNGTGGRDWPTEKSLAALRSLVEKSSIPTPKLSAKHLLLTLSSSRPSVASGSTLQCAFTAGIFDLPDNNGSGGEVLYGLDTWEPLEDYSNTSVQIIGGTFSLAIASEAQRPALVKVLRLSVFTYLSLILEQSVLADSQVALRFPKPSLSPRPPAGQASGSIARAMSTGHVSTGKASTKRDSSLWAYFSKKKDDILLRAAPSLIRRGSLELPLARQGSRSRSPVPSPRASQEHTSPNVLPRPRRFSFISDIRPSFMLPSSDANHVAEVSNEQAVEHPISVALASLEKARVFLSTSPNLSFLPPGILLKLAAREKSDPNTKFGGDDRAALASLLGWDTRQLRAGTAGQGMVDTSGFVRQQSLSVLYSEYVPRLISRPPTPTTAHEVQAPPEEKLRMCGKRRRWVTFKFYSDADECLGEALCRMCARADEPCDNADCHTRRGDHELRLTHAGVRITILVTDGTDHKPEGEEEIPEMWSSCRVCNKSTSKRRMQDGTYLLSFAKYLELLLYSISLCSITPALCEHTALPPRPWEAPDTPMPRSRLNIMRHFALFGRLVTLSLSMVEDVYDVRVPRLQILRPRFEKYEEVEEQADKSPASPTGGPGEADRRVLRREIMQFWQVLSEQMDTLEGNFVSEHSDNSYHKSLPRLPSADDAYTSYDEDGLVTPKGQPSGLPPHPPNTPRTPQANSPSAFPFPQGQDHEKFTLEKGGSEVPSTPSAISASSSAEFNSLQLLTSMRHTFQRAEQDLYAELSRTPWANLNDVRRSFVSAGRGATKRLSAWEAKHASGPAVVSDAILQTEPEWWKAGCHAVPGGNVIVRENDWGSIIAFTLSSMDYQRELANFSSNRTSVVPLAPPTTPAVTRPSFFSRTSSSRWFNSSQSSPDPDQEGVVWHEPESYSAVISRKEHPRDTASLIKLGITEVLRQKTLPDASGSSTPSRLTNILGSGSKGIAMGAPPAAWAKPDVQISRQAVDGQLSFTSKEGIDKVLQDLEAAAEPTKSVRSSWSDSSHLSGFVETNIRRGQTSSIISTNSAVSTIGEHTSSSQQLEPPTPPPKDSANPEHTSEPSVSTNSKLSTDPSSPSLTGDAPSMSTALSNTFSSALRYMLKSSSPPPVPVKHHHGLLTTGSPAIDDKPHIKYDWIIGKRLKFSCTVYYAKQFDALRRRCGIEDVFLKSLSRSENWAAEGGKSRSNFWKTSDNQFIIKTLVNAWNVADLHVLIDLGPSYFKHIDSTANKPTVLAKLLGFYTVEIKNLETGSTQAKADLLVMENLFYNQTIVKTFDLKGIQGRKVKAASSGAGSTTLFDGDWIEGQQRALSLVKSHSKVVLQEAIKADSDFLARSNIMDYSLLVGIDEERKQIACGLVDTIGSYTFAKTLEYKAKQNLSSGKDVTVIPPNEYQERFVTAMDNYFVACPDKWTKPLDDTKISGDYRLLPSVL